MRKIVECVPNFSEGRRSDIVEQIKEAIERLQDHLLKLLDEGVKIVVE